MGNAAISPQELKALRAKYDVNRDGRLALAEAKGMAEEIRRREGVPRPIPDAKLKQLFYKLDRDGSGFITQDEFVGAYNVLRQQRQASAKGAAPSGKSGKGTPPRARSASPQGTPRGKESMSPKGIPRGGPGNTKGNKPATSNDDPKGERSLSPSDARTTAAMESAATATGKKRASSIEDHKRREARSLASSKASKSNAKAETQNPKTGSGSEVRSETSSPPPDNGEESTFFDGQWTKEGENANPKYIIVGAAIEFEDKTRHLFRQKNRTCILHVGESPFNGAFTNDGKIEWDNGAIWSRERKHSCEGIWQKLGSADSYAISGPQVVFIEREETFKFDVQRAMVSMNTEGKLHTGKLVRTGRIEWDNDVVWYRADKGEEAVEKSYSKCFFDGRWMKVGGEDADKYLVAGTKIKFLDDDSEAGTQPFGQENDCTCTLFEFTGVYTDTGRIQWSNGTSWARDEYWPCDGYWNKEKDTATFAVSGERVAFFDVNDIFKFEQKEEGCACKMEVNLVPFEGQLVTGDRIEWQNGTAWIRKYNLFDGSWIESESGTTFIVEGSTIVLVDDDNDRHKFEQTRGFTCVLDIGSKDLVTGELTADGSLQWSNNFFWSRGKPGRCDGRWIQQGAHSNSKGGEASFYTTYLVSGPHVGALDSKEVSKFEEEQMGDAVICKMEVAGRSFAGRLVHLDRIEWSNHDIWEREKVFDLFDGCWVNRLAGAEFKIRGDVVIFLADNTRRKIVQSPQCSCSFEIDGSTYTGEYSPDGVLQWSNGSSWIRKEVRNDDSLGFNGVWRVNGTPSAYAISGGKVVFLESLSLHRFLQKSKKECMMDVEGDFFAGRMSNSSRIEWSNGVIWARESRNASAATMALPELELPPQADLDLHPRSPMSTMVAWAPKVAGQVQAERRGRGNKNAPEAQGARRPTLRHPSDDDAGDMWQVDPTAILPEELSDLSEAESGSSGDSISGGIARPWDSHAGCHRYRTACDRVVGFSERWAPLKWKEKDWETHLKKEGILVSHEKRQHSMSWKQCVKTGAVMLQTSSWRKGGQRELWSSATSEVSGTLTPRSAAGQVSEEFTPRSASGQAGDASETLTPQSASGQGSDVDGHGYEDDKGDYVHNELLAREKQVVIAMRTALSQVPELSPIPAPGLRGPDLVEATGLCRGLNRHAQDLMRQEEHTKELCMRWGRQQVGLLTPSSVDPSRQRQPRAAVERLPASDPWGPSVEPEAERNDRRWL